MGSRGPLIGGLRTAERVLLDHPDEAVRECARKLGQARLACNEVQDRTRGELLAATGDQGALYEAHEELCEAFAVLLKSRERLIGRVDDLQNDLQARAEHPDFEAMQEELDRVRRERDDATQRANDAFALGRRSARAA